MKRLYVLTVMFCLSIFLVVTAHAAAGGNKGAPTGKKGTTEWGTPYVTGTPQGLANLQKVVSYRIERSKKMHKKIEGSSEDGK